MACDCMTKLDEDLKEHNTRLSSMIVFSDPVGVFAHIGTEQIETGRGKKKAMAVKPNFCPFCGVRYEPAASTAERAS